LQASVVPRIGVRSTSQGPVVQEPVVVPEKLPVYVPVLVVQPPELVQVVEELVVAPPVPSLDGDSTLPGQARSAIPDASPSTAQVG
jgi:hypothetical protein